MMSVWKTVIANTDALSHFPYVTTFRRIGGSASEEAIRVRKKYRQNFEKRKKYRQNFENVGSVPRQLEAIRRGGQFQSNVISKHNIHILI